jgi:hypothetical protein
MLINIVLPNLNGSIFPLKAAVLYWLYAKKMPKGFNDYTAKTEKEKKAKKAAKSSKRRGKSIYRL